MTASMLGREVGVAEWGRLETFPSRAGQERVVLTGDELSALCPEVDGLQPDLYRFRVAYRPVRRCLETKSFKLYLLTFRDRRIFAEHLGVEIAEDLAAALATSVHVTLEQSRRGGIETKTTALAGPGLTGERRRAQALAQLT